MWDSSIIAYGIKNNNLSGAKQFLFEAHWEVIYFFAYVINQFSSLLNLEYYLVYKVIICVIFFLVIKELRFFSENLFSFTKIKSFFVALLFSTFPAWHLLFSSIFIGIIFCLFLLFFTTRFMQKGFTVFNVFTSCFLCILSFQLNSLLIMVPLICLMYDYKKVSQKQEFCISKSISNFRRSTIAVVLAILYFVIRNVCFPTYGEYASYNRVGISYDRIYVNFKWYLTFFVIPLVIFLLFYFLIKGLKINDIFGDFVKFTFHSNLVFIIILIFGSMAPYILVGKSSDIRAFNFWSFRHSILLAPFLSCFIVLCIFRIYYLFHSKPFHRYLLVSVLLSLAVAQSLLLYMGSFNKLDRQLLEDVLSKNLSSNSSRILSGTLRLELDYRPIPNFTLLDINYLISESLRSSGVFALSYQQLEMPKDFVSEMQLDLVLQLRNNISYTNNYCSSVLSLGIKRNSFLESFMYSKVSRFEIINESFQRSCEYGS